MIMEGILKFMEGILLTLVQNAAFEIISMLSYYMSYFVTDEISLYLSVREKIMFLKSELEAMNAFLLKMSQVEETDERDKYWIKEVQKLSHDIHDTMNDPMLLVNDRTMITNLWKYFKTRRKILKKVNNLQDLVIELGNRYARYKVDYNISNATNSCLFGLLESCITWLLGNSGYLMIGLFTLLRQEYTLSKSACDKIVFLKTELETMNDFLLKMSRVEECDEQDKYWRKEMQKLSQDIQDSISDFLPLLDDNTAQPKGFKGFMTRIMNLLKHIKTRGRLQKVITLQTQVIEVRKRQARYKVDYNISNAANSRGTEHDVLEHILDGTKEPTNLPLELLKSITRNFSEEREIGQGGFGIVYKGVLKNGIVAVKRILNHHRIDERLFYREVNSLLNVNHENVVRFLGYCSCNEEKAMKIEGVKEYIYAEIRERLLCFEYISNGSLHDYITDELRGLEWNRRYQIIKQICDGLLYLHKEKHILHMDLKPDNILLDDHMVAKITDFGLSRLDEKSQTTDANHCVTLGYSAPEYLHGGRMSLKSDMYSLGVIIIEMVTGYKDIPDNLNARVFYLRVLRRWWHRWNKSLKETSWAYQQLQITKCIGIGLHCRESDPYNRPFIWDVIHNINRTEGTFGQTSNANEPDVDQIRPYWDDDMLGIEPLKLHFYFEPNKQILCLLQLTNNTTANTAFSIQPVSLMSYCVQPTKGIVPPLSSCTVYITLLPRSRPPRDRKHPGEFIVRSTKVTGGVTAEEITSSMFNKVSGELVDEVKLDVVFDMSV